MQHYAAFHLGFNCLQKDLLRGFRIQRVKIGQDCSLASSNNDLYYSDWSQGGISCCVSCDSHLVQHWSHKQNGDIALKNCCICLNRSGHSSLFI